MEFSCGFALKKITFITSSGELHYKLHTDSVLVSPMGWFPFTLYTGRLSGYGETPVEPGANLRFDGAALVYRVKEYTKVHLSWKSVNNSLFHN